TCGAGARLAHALEPGTDPAGIADRLAAVSEVRRVLEDSDLPIHGLPDLEPVLAEAEPDGALLPGTGVAAVAKSLHIVARLKAYLHERRELMPGLARRTQTLESLGELRGRIDQQIGPDGEVLDRATPVLRKIRREQEVTRNRLLEQLRRIVRGLASSDGEAVVTLRNDRHVIQVRRDRSSDLQGVVHGQSGSGASIYLEPSAVVPANNELAELRSAEDDEVRRILTELTAGIRAHLDDLIRNELVLADLDLLYAAGRWSRDVDGRPALPSRNGGVLVRQGRHPLLEAALQDEGGTLIPLTLELGGARPRTLVITGPNTGGKTVALKTVGLFALMNQCGLHVPAAEGTAFPVFRDVFADIGDEQSIEASLSTFSSHMAHVNELLREAGSDTLVLLDELGVGTDPEEGAGLGKAILSELTRNGSLTIVTTHYGSLKVFAHETEGMENASLEFDRDSLGPTYTFLQGVPGSSEALAIARRLGFPPHLVEEARQHVGRGQEKIEGLLHDLQERRRELEERTAELDAERADLERREEQIERRLDGLTDEKSRIKREAMEEARRLVERSKAELTDLLGAVKSDGTGGRAAGRARTRLGEMGNELQRGLAEETHTARAPVQPATPEQVTEGTPVFIPSMGWKGTALGAPGSSGKVAVSVGALRVEVPVDSLELRGDPAPAKSAPRPKAPAVAARPEGESRTEIDLRGRTVEEAVDEVDRVLDGLVVAGGTWLRIIHGKGTGALRTAIGEQLGTDTRIKSFRSGEPAEGGTGVTIAVLK
ncbi:MAG: endonuclease MutS2, partial [Gemmatimonadetes bacterium]|nr:endonuclease MutS2 [Gemmatimonadota bacterium]